MKKVAIIMGSKSDLQVVQVAYDEIRRFGIKADMRIMSAHRCPDEVAAFAKNAQGEGYGVIIAAAGKAAHLAGVVAGNTVLPVIGLPIKSSTLDGLDSLLSVVQMPSGVPVATVAINGGKNAGLLAVQILALYDEELLRLLAEDKEAMKKSVIKDDEELRKTLL